MKNPIRLIAAVTYLVISLVLINLIFANKHVFIYNRTIEDFGNWPRLLYCFSFSLAGFGSAALKAYFDNKNEKNKLGFLLSYLTFYMVAIAVTSILCFVIFNAMRSVNNYLFYYIAAIISYILGYTSDLFVTPHQLLQRLVINSKVIKL